MANKLYAMEQLTEEVAKDVATSPQEWMRFLNTSSRLYKYTFPEQLFNFITATGSNCRSIHGNLESEDVPLDQKGIQGDCLD